MRAGGGVCVVVVVVVAAAVVCACAFACACVRARARARVCGAAARVLSLRSDCTAAHVGAHVYTQAGQSIGQDGLDSQRAGRAGSDAADGPGATHPRQRIRPG